MYTSRAGPRAKRVPVRCELAPVLCWLRGQAGGQAATNYGLPRLERCRKLWPLPRPPRCTLVVRQRVQESPSSQHSTAGGQQEA